MIEYPQNAHHGFLVVRLPEYNFDAEGRGYAKNAPKLGDILRRNRQNALVQYSRRLLYRTIVTLPAVGLENNQSGQLIFHRNRCV